MKYKITELTRKRRTKVQKPWGEDLGEVMNFIITFFSTPKGQTFAGRHRPGDCAHEKEKN